MASIDYAEYIQLSTIAGAYSVSADCDAPSIRVGEMTIPTNCKQLVMKDVPAFKSEKYISSQDCYRTSTEFYVKSIGFPGQSK